MQTPKYTVFALLAGAAGVSADNAALALRQVSVPNDILSNLPKDVSTGVADILSNIGDPTQLLSLVSSACRTLIDNIPTPASDFFSGQSIDFKDVKNLDKLCMTTPPPSLSSQFSSYQSVLSSWESQNRDKISSCPLASPILSCVGLASQTGSGSAAAQTGGRTGNNAPRPTGMAAAAVAAAGLAAIAL